MFVSSPFAGTLFLAGHPAFKVTAILNSSLRGDHGPAGQPRQWSI